MTLTNMEKDAAKILKYHNFNEAKRDEMRCFGGAKFGIDYDKLWLMKSMDDGDIDDPIKYWYYKLYPSYNPDEIEERYDAAIAQREIDEHPDSDRLMEFHESWPINETEITRDLYPDLKQHHSNVTDRMCTKILQNIHEDPGLVEQLLDQKGDHDMPFDEMEEFFGYETLSSFLDDVQRKYKLKSPSVVEEKAFIRYVFLQNKEDFTPELSKDKALEFYMPFIASTTVIAKTKYYDGEIRPYEFGYRIEGNQHRHEKKDANGIINGEFGFITADGVYHQSVYATDENGNFKLISFKSSFKFEKPSTTTGPPTTTVPPAPLTAATHSLKLLKSCSDCRVFEKVIHDKSSQLIDVPVTETKEGVAVPKKIVMSLSPNKIPNNDDLPKIRVKSNKGMIGTVSPIDIALGMTGAGIRASETIKLKRKEITESQGNISSPNHKDTVGNKALPKIKEKSENENTKTINETPSSYPTSKPVHSAQVAIPVSLQTKSVTIPSTHPTSKPIHSPRVAIPVSLQTKSEISVPISTDHITNSKTIESSKTHMSSKNAINEFIGDVLYRFNYTAGYHGHNEEGDSAGNKRGGYFIVGRDNIRRGVIYVANANGFVPVVKYEKVSPAEAPHEDTEKGAGLRGYEFEWFHTGKSKADSLSESGR
ncbi:hypothetical protein HA402_002890 [Bradysia odoriphaga]|nr:hypothetical protein HA402_002890 [Bradysia odoriphaga]